MEPGLKTAPKEMVSSKKLLRNYSRYPIGFKFGNGQFLFDHAGKKYYDFLCGIAVTSFGHNHPEIKLAVQKQFDSFWHTSNLFESKGQEELAEKLAEKSGLDNVFFCNSGTEANEAAIKFARMWGKDRFHIIPALNSFHGRTFGSLSASGQEKLWKGFKPLLPGFSYVDFGDVNAIDKEITKNTVAVMLETIQGEGGIKIPQEDYIKNVREICSKKNILLIIDEIQTGIGRTGKFFSYQHENVLPDIITVAKGIANGLPLGATICTKEIGELMIPGSHGSTFGGNPVAVAAGNAVVNLLTDEMLSNISGLGKTFLAELEKINSSLIKEIRGKGLMIGVELEESVSAKGIATKLLGKGILCGTAGQNVLRILPPFIITKEDIHIFAETLEKVLNEVSL